MQIQTFQFKFKDDSKLKASEKPWFNECLHDQWAAFHLNCKSEFPDPFNFPFLYSNLLFLLFTLFFPGYSFQDSTPFHWFLYPASPLLYPNPPLFTPNLIFFLLFTLLLRLVPVRVVPLPWHYFNLYAAPPPPTTLIIVNYSYDVVTGELFIQLGNYIIW